MFEKIFGKKNSIQRNLTLIFVIGILIVVVITIIGYYILIDDQIINKLIQLHDSEELSQTIRRNVILMILNTIVISIILIQLISRRMIKPIKQITEATKKVAAGDFSVKLETNRKDEIQDLVDNFNQMVNDLGSIECLQKKFIDNVSHEIKTPISSIQGFAELLKDESLTKEEREEYASIIMEESNRLLNLSTNMLKLSKLQNQNKIAKKEQIDIAEQIRKAISLLEPRWSKKEITLNVSLEEKYFLGDEELIFQVWVNLIENAIKYSGQNSKIDITLKQEDNFIVVRIKDYGKGMQEEELNKIFSRFYQIDKSHSSEGSGLGLAIVKRIVELSEGTIEVASQENEGTTMEVRLPVEMEENKILIK